VPRSITTLLSATWKLSLLVPPPLPLLLLLRRRVVLCVWL